MCAAARSTCTRARCWASPGWSAPVEFVHEQGLVKYNLAPTYGMEEFVPFYDMSMNWAEPHLAWDDERGRLLRLLGRFLLGRCPD